MSNLGLSRRHFFYGTLLAGAIPTGGFGSTSSLVRLGYKSPNEKLNIAAIGAGGRAEVNIRGVDSENIVAFADPDSNRAANVFGWYEKVPRYTDFRRMLDKEGNNIDAVLVSTPDHIHTVAALACMERGKHVYVEKPLARTVWETRQLMKAAVKYNVATQMGNQGYSSDGERIASEIVWSGDIGNVTEVHSWTDRPIWPQGMTSLPPEEKAPNTLDWDIWLGPAKARPYSSAYLPFNWRGWIDFGSGAMGDGACHSMGSVNMALRLGAPTSVEAIKKDGFTPYSYPKKTIIRYDFPARGAMSPVKIFWYEGVTEPPYRPEGLAQDDPFIGGRDAFGSASAPASKAPQGRGTQQSGSKTQASSKTRGGTGGFGSANFVLGNAAVFVGDKGCITTDGYGERVRLLPNSRHQEYQLPPKTLTRSPGHYNDWIRACKGGEPACSNFAVSGPFTEWAILGLVALRFEGKLEWDGAKMRFTNHPEANEFLKPFMRKGWEPKNIA
jgi:predicted dehydrogenase